MFTVENESISFGLCFLLKLVCKLPRQSFISLAFFRRKRRGIVIALASSSAAAASSSAASCKNFDIF